MLGQTSVVVYKVNYPYYHLEIEVSLNPSEPKELVVSNLVEVVCFNFFLEERVQFEGIGKLTHRLLNLSESRIDDLTYRVSFPFG